MKNAIEGNKIRKYRFLVLQEFIILVFFFEELVPCKPLSIVFKCDDFPPIIMFDLFYFKVTKRAFLISLNNLNHDLFMGQN